MHPALEKIRQKFLEHDLGFACVIPSITGPANASTAMTGE